jgi:hypothetical protein
MRDTRHLKNVETQAVGEMLAPASKGTNFAGLAGATWVKKLFWGTPTRLRGAQVPPPLQTRQVPTEHQRKQLPSSAPNRRGEIETRRTRWLSRVNPMAGSWSLATCPRSYRPVSPGEKQPEFWPHFVGKGTRRNWRLGDFPRIIIKRQEESARVIFCAAGEDWRASWNAWT